jgi:uncharacterized protein (DUF1778 family)
MKKKPKAKEASPRRTKRLEIRLSAEEHRILEWGAAADHDDLSSWVRRVALLAALPLARRK